MHGFYSDKSAAGRFDQLSAVLNAAAIDAFAFDFSGCGESDDEIINFSTEIDDLNSAIQFSKQAGYVDISLYGHSLGSYICLACYSPVIKTMVLSDALTGPMQFAWDKHFSDLQLQELKEKGYITETRTRGTRERILIDGQMLDAYSKIDQKVLLSPVKCPVLIIHGDSDAEEKQLLENSRSAMQFLDKRSRLEIIKGADHSMMEHWDSVMAFAVSWYKKLL